MHPLRVHPSLLLPITSCFLAVCLTSCILLPLDDVVETSDGVETQSDATDEPATDEPATDEPATDEPAVTDVDAAAGDDGAMTDEDTDAEPTDEQGTDDVETDDAPATDDAASDVDAEPTDAEPTDAEPTDAEPTDAEPTDGSTDALDCECGASECGSDGCGGSCGDCDTGESCQAGSCVTACDAQTVVVDNNVPDRMLYSPYCGRYVYASTLIYVASPPDSSWVVTHTDPLEIDVSYGQTVSFEYFCCVLDTYSCFNGNVCSIGANTYDCACETAVREFTVEANSCEDYTAELVCP